MFRTWILRGILVVTLALLIGRLYQLQLTDSDDAQRYGTESIDVITTRYVLVSPRRGAIVARDGQTLLAQSMPVYNVAVRPGSLPPADDPARATILGRMAQVLTLTSTLTLSPTLAAQPATPTTPDAPIWADLAAAGVPITERPAAAEWEVPPARTLDVLRVTERYSNVLRLNNPIEERLRTGQISNYQTLTIKEDISRDLALALAENSTYLPGVVILEDYRRTYPQSATVPSLSHLIGYIGRINRCELAATNPTGTWLTAVSDIVTHAAECGVVSKDIASTRNRPVNIPIYQPDDRIGKDGLEAGYEDVLRGNLGVNTLGVDALNRPISDARVMQPVQDGYNLVTTIDLAFQQEVQTILQRWIDEGERRRAATTDHRNDYKPIVAGSAVVLDVKTGEVLAMVSLPTYDNNVWVDPDRATDLQNLLAPADPEALAELIRQAPLTNRAIAGRYPPGSTLKPFIGAVALQQGVITADTELRDPGEISIAQKDGTLFTLPNSLRRDNGEIDLSEALRVSSNVFFAAIAGGNDQATNLGEDYTKVTGIQIDNLATGLNGFGMGEPTGIQLPGETGGRVPTPGWKAHTLREPWTTGDTFNASIGQGYLEMTPLQLADALSAIANNGYLLEPRLVRATTDRLGNVVEEYAPVVRATVPIDPQHYYVLREGMRRSVTDGANIAARDDCSGLAIAGKTGTAEFGPVIEVGDRQSRQSHAWFAGFAPYDDPQIAVVVLVEGVGDLDDGSATIAVPAVTQVMQAYFNIAPPTGEARDAEGRPLPPAGCPLLPQ